MKIFAALVLLLSLSGCSALSGFAMDAITGGSDTGGINTDVELVVGDKNVDTETVVGTKTVVDVKAEEVGKVVAHDDVSTNVEGTVDSVEVTNVNYPTWLIAVLLIGNVVFLWLPTPPTPSWKGFLNLFKRGK